MNTHALESGIDAQQAVAETQALTQSGFTQDEIAFLLKLRQWYQNGGSDRADMLRHWEFLKFLVSKGKLQL